jgi:hypothetical protein
MNREIRLVTRKYPDGPIIPSSIIRDCLTVEG